MHCIAMFLGFLVRARYIYLYRPSFSVSLSIAPFMCSPDTSIPDVLPLEEVRMWTFPPPYVSAHHTSNQKFYFVIYTYVRNENWSKQILWSSVISTSYVEVYLSYIRKHVCTRYESLSSSSFFSFFFYVKKIVNRPGLWVFACQNSMHSSK